MSWHLRREMEKLNRSVLEMSARVEQAVLDAARAFLNRDAELADQIIERDRRIDHQEMEIAEEGLKILALYQPVARDLRFIYSLGKISGILERIGDLAENLARKGKSLNRWAAVAIPEDFSPMAEQVRGMLKNGIDSLIERDPKKAAEVIKADREVNQAKRDIRKAAESALQAAPAAFPQWLIIVAASRNLERIGDLAANIAAEVVYCEEGRIARHGFDCE
ncbi:MAG: phosphate signaling complex protein PhoU [Planctomycetota bacterium]|jgi:phosphate transport system protein|nr:phosphate signaling complex protein PhoU [Planctomycetota bacterium]